MIITLIFVLALAGKLAKKPSQPKRSCAKVSNPQHSMSQPIYPGPCYPPMPVMVQVITHVQHVPVPVEVQTPKKLRNRILTDELLQGLGYQVEEASGFVETLPSTDGRPHQVLSLDAEFITVLDSEGQQRSAVYKIALVSSTGMVLMNDYVQLPKGCHLALSPSQVKVVEPIDEILRETDRGYSFEEVQSFLIQHISQETILIVHSGKSDLQALKLIHKNVVDISVEFPVQDDVTREMFYDTGRFSRKSLQTMCKDIGLDVQQGIHDPVEDAMGTLEVMASHLSVDERQIYRFQEKMLLDYQKSKGESQYSILNRKGISLTQSQTMWLPPQDRKAKSASSSDSNDLFRPRSESASASQMSEATPSFLSSERTDLIKNFGIDFPKSLPLQVRPPVPNEAPPPPPTVQEKATSNRNRWNRRNREAKE